MGKGTRSLGTDLVSFRLEFGKFRLDALERIATQSASKGSNSQKQLPPY